MSIETELRTFEEQLLQADFRRNREAVTALLADDFREFGSSGRIWTKQQILDELETEPVFEAALGEFQATELAPGVDLVTYTVTVQSSSLETCTSLRSSIWIKRDGRWQMLFHQGTLISDDRLKYLKSGRVASPEFMDEVEDLPPQERDF